MPQVFENETHLGILKGGQLGRMLLQPCMDFGIIPHILDNDSTAPAQTYCHHFTTGNSLNFDDVYNFGKSLDVVTLEFENVNLEALKKLQSEGIKVFPKPDLIEIVQDKGLQKEFYQRNDLPTSNFKLVKSREEVAEILKEKSVVQKKRVAGYDGRGVCQLNSLDDLDKAFDEPSVVEDKVAIKKEISVLVARNESGDIKTFPTVEMVFHHEANMLDYLFSPAQINPAHEDQAQKLARTLAEKLDLVGLLAVELFIDQNENILINEIAPRSHNSGHHTIEGNVTSQFSQQIRAIFNLPLGSTEMHAPAVMINIVGEPGHEGPVSYEGLEPFLETPGIYFHIYGKKMTRPYRKMGHVTVVNENLNKCLEIAKQIKEKVKAVSCQK